MEKLADGRAVGAWHPDAGVQFAGRNSRRRWWLTSPVHQGDHGGAVKTIAQEMPGTPGEPVVTTLVCFVLFCMRGCGCIAPPAFPAPSFPGGKEDSRTTRAKLRRGNVFGCLKGCE